MNFQSAELKKPRPYRACHYSPEPGEWKALDPVDWSRPAVIEIGCGKGTWLVHEARTHPESLYIGIERTLNRSRGLLHSAAKAGLPNLITLRADAVPLLHHRVPAQSVDELCFFYPNPTPKKNQANKRFFVGSSFEVFDRCLKKNGTIYLATNIAGYIGEAKNFLEKIWGYQITCFGKIDAAAPPRTEFERKYRERGEDLWELRAVKTQTSFNSS